MRKILGLLAVLVLALPLGLQAAEVKTVFDREYYPAALKMIDDAKESISLAMFEIRYYPDHLDSPSNLLVKGLVLANRRGVKVEVCLDRSKGYNEENSRRNLEVGRRLTEQKIKVYLDGSKGTMHAKFLVVDGRFVLLGSTNWAYYSLAINQETNLLVDSRETAGRFLNYFEEIKKKSTLLTDENRDRL